MRINYKMPKPKFHCGDVVIYKNESDYDEPFLYVVVGITLNRHPYGHGEWEYTARGQLWGSVESAVSEDEIILWIPQQDEDVAEVEAYFYKHSIPNRCQDWSECECQDGLKCLVTNNKVRYKILIKKLFTVFITRWRVGFN